MNRYETERGLVGRDVNGTDIFRPYSNSIQSGRVFIRPYLVPSIRLYIQTKTNISIRLCIRKNIKTNTISVISVSQSPQLSHHADSHHRFISAPFIGAGRGVT